MDRPKQGAEQGAYVSVEFVMHIIVLREGDLRIKRAGDFSLVGLHSKLGQERL